MSLPPERYTEIDAELQNIHVYLASLADELMHTSNDDTLEFSASAVYFAANHMIYIRQMLKLAWQKAKLND